MAFTEPSSAYTTFPLFNDLLPELRLKVYEFALASPTILSFTHEDYLHQGKISAWSLSAFQGVSLLRSSWKTYNEALLTLSLMMRSMMHCMSEVLMSMKDASIYMRRSANMITPNGGKWQR